MVEIYNEECKFGPPMWLFSYGEDLYISRFLPTNEKTMSREIVDYKSSNRVFIAGEDKDG